MELSVCERPIDQAESEVGEAVTHSPAPRRVARKSAVQIRLPVDKDWAAIRELVRKHHARTIFAHIPFSEAKYEALEKEARSPAPHQCLIGTDFLRDSF